MVAIARLNGLSLNEQMLIQEIVQRVVKNKPYNAGRREYYEAHRQVRDLGIAVPPQLKNTMQALGWAGTVVDSLDERLDLDGVMLPGVEADEDPYGVQGIYDDNEIDLLYPEAHIDSLIHGVAFLAADKGGDGEQDAVITYESPENFSGIYDPRRRALSSAAGVEWDTEGKPKQVRLYQAKSDVIVQADKSAVGGWTVVDRPEHKMPRPMVRRLINRARGSRQWGRSEITRPIVSYTDSAMRTLLGAEVAREFYLSPQRWIMGADESDFVDKDGNRVSPWKAYMGRFLALAADEDGNMPQVGEFDAASPGPYIEMVKMYAQLVAGEAGLPAHYLGFVSENPSSADAIRADEARHVKRAERRQKAFGAAWRGILLDAYMLQNNVTTVPDELKLLRMDWRDASTPTRAATADAATKLVGQKILTPTSEVLYKSLGYNETQIKLIREEHRQAQGDELAQLLRANAMNAAAQNPALAAAAGQTRAVPEGE